MTFFTGGHFHLHTFTSSCRNAHPETIMPIWLPSTSPRQFIYPRSALRSLSTTPTKAHPETNTHQDPSDYAVPQNAFSPGSCNARAATTPIIRQILGGVERSIGRNAVQRPLSQGVRGIRASTTPIIRHIPGGVEEGTGRRCGIQNCHIYLKHYCLLLIPTSKTSRKLL